jgi:glycosyltransferase involved in cell wall biosynthesis
VDPVEHAILQRLDDVDRRLRDTQAMASRAYEAALAWPRLLEDVRSSPEYEAAYEPEPLVTVRISTYNQSSLLCARALASLRRQTYERWEALVVGDACDDDTEERVAALGDSRIRFWNLPFRGPYPDDARARWFVAGIPPANAAIAAARGRWIAPLDHDDEWDDDHIEVLLAAALGEHAELAYSRMRVVNDSTGERSELGRWPPVMGQFAFQSAIHHAGLAAFPYDANCRFAEEPGDWNLARRMWAAGVRFTFIDRVTGTYHHVPKHATRNAEERMIEELRGWAGTLQQGLDWWKARAESLEGELARARGDIETHPDTGSDQTLR